jgi:hypothetical protein
MKIALCISGQPRFIDVTFPYIQKNILEVNDCDVFFHTWFDKGKSYDGAAWSPITTPEDSIPDKLLELYKPKKWLIEPNKNEFFKQQSAHIIKNTEAEPYITKSMFYTIKQSNELKNQYSVEKNVHYDVTIRLRFDVAIMSQLIIDNVFSQCLHYVDVIRNPLVPCDWCFYGPDKTMNVCMNVYDHIDQYAGQNVPICGEELINHHIQVNNIGKLPRKIGALLVRDNEFSDKTWGRTY